MREIIGLALLPLSACTLATSNATADDPRPSPVGTCKGDALSQFVGQAASQQLGERILAVSGARYLRWVPHGTAVTMEFNPARVTIFLDAANRVERASCT